MTTEFIEVRGITKHFHEKHVRSVLALQNFSLSIGQGEFVSIVGPSGCGKTTLLNMLAGLAPYFPPESGELIVDGKAIAGPSAERGMVFQEYALLPWKSVQDNIELPLKFAGVPKAERDERSRYYVELLGLSGFERKFPFQLSGGMRQRVAVARALINKPKVLLMDEPFAAVDAQTRMTLQEELTRVWEQVRNTVLFVTHSIEEAIFLADRVIVMSRRPGRILADLRPHLPRPRLWATIKSEPEWIGAETEILGLITRPTAGTRT